MSEAKPITVEQERRRAVGAAYVLRRDAWTLFGLMGWSQQQKSVGASYVCRVVEIGMGAR